MSEWQPIESAPKDGTEVLGYHSALTPSMYVCAHERTGWYIGEEYAVEPTHWQPLPPPPKHLDPQPKIG